MKRILRFFRNLWKRSRRPKTIRVLLNGGYQDAVPIGAKCGLLEVRLSNGSRVMISQWLAADPEAFDRAWESFPQEAHWEGGDPV